MTFFQELKRRNVFRVVAAYVVMSWLLMQVADVALEAFDVPDWTFRFLIILLAIGLIPVAVFSWVFEMTPDGIRRESDLVDASPEMHATGRKLDYLTIGMVLVGIAVVVYQQQRPPAPSQPASTSPESSIAVTAPRQAADEAPPLDDPKSIAVLPFVNMSSDQENEYFADGLSEELLNQLAQIPDLQVAGRTSSFSFKGKNEDLRVIGKTLGVANVLEGSVRRQGDKVRVTAQVIRVHDGFHLWSNTYDRTMDDVFAIQDDISTNVADALKIVLDEAARQRMQEAGVRNVEAFVEFQKGWQWFEKAHGGSNLMSDLRQGMVHYERAIERVPDFGKAYWHMADYYAHILLDPDSTIEEKPPALQKLRSVLDSAYQYASNPTRQAFIDVDRVLWSNDWSTLRDRIEKALAAEGCPDPSWIEIATAIGYAKPAGDMWVRYQRCEPLSTMPAQQQAWAQFHQGDFEGALDTIQKAELVHGTNAWYAANRQGSYMALGRVEEALALAPEVARDVAFYGMGAKALPLARAGDKQGALLAMEQFSAENGPDPRGELKVHAALGNREKANELAAHVDEQAGGSMALMILVDYCGCGAPFDLEVTPNFRERVNEANIEWPPRKIIDYPLKTW